MRRLSAWFLIFLITIVCIPIASSEQEDWLSEYASAGINVLYVPADELEKNRDDYFGQVVCTTLYYTSKSSQDNRIYATMATGKVYDFDATFENPDEYSSLGEDDVFTVVGLSVPGSALDFGDVHLYDCHIIAEGEHETASYSSLNTPVKLVAADTDVVDVNTLLSAYGFDPASVIGLEASVLKENHDDYVGKTVYTVLFFEGSNGDDTMYARITPSGIYCYDAAFTNPSEFAEFVENDICVVVGTVGPGEFFDFGDVHLTESHILATGIQAQAIYAMLTSSDHDNYKDVKTTTVSDLNDSTADIPSASSSIDIESASTVKPTPSPIPTPISTTSPPNAGLLGETLTFGSYEQDGQLGNGAEPIEWRVINIDDDKSLLLSECALDRQPYNTSRTDVTWATSSLRAWLNSTFINAAFTADEQAIIQSSTISTVDSYGLGSRLMADGGENTTDKVFILSVDEVDALRYDFSSLGFLNTEPTSYARSRGAYTDESGYCWWWLRTPGANQSSAAISKDVQYQSVEIDTTGVVVDSLGTCVRPAIWVDTAALNAYLSNDQTVEGETHEHIVLKRGSKGTDVKALQERLIALDFLVDSADGDFGAKTEAALIAYQTAAGLEATGVYDEQTAANIYAEDAPTPTPEPTPDPKSIIIKRGDRNEDVRQLQLRLIALGYLVGPADGIFGGKTEAALIAYQDAADLPETGECDYNTLQSVTSSSAPIAPTATPTPKPTVKPTNDDDYSGGTTYIGNKNTKKFHYSWCSSVDQMNDSNKVSLSSREDAINRGYEPCKRCNP